jgi:hypothetical protein
MDFSKKQTVSSMAAFIEEQSNTFLSTQNSLEAAGMVEVLERKGADAVSDLLEANPALGKTYDDWVDSCDNLGKARVHIGEHFSSSEKKKLRSAVSEAFFKIDW